MNKLFALLALAFFGQSVLASSVRWNVQVTNPEFELTNYKLSAKKYKMYLPITSWRCWSGPSKLKGDLESKALTCNYSVEKTGQVTTFVSCSSKRPYDEGILELYDERKKLNYKIMLVCQRS